MIQATQLFKSYSGLNVLKGVDLQINAGEVVAIMGASGAGKTTLLQILGTLDKMDSGSLQIRGKELSKFTPKQLAAFRNKEIGFVFQFHQLLPEFTAIENVCIPALIAKQKWDQAKIRANELLSLLGLESRLSHKPSELSGGEQQRVAVARALMNQPAVILADEPSGNLDSKSATALHELFFELRGKFNQTFVIVTHNPELANMSDRILTMKDGVIVSA